MSGPPILDDDLSPRNDPPPEEPRLLRQIRVGRIVLFVLAGIFGLVCIGLLFNGEFDGDDPVRKALTGAIAGFFGIMTTACIVLGWLTPRWPIPAFSIGILAFLLCYLKFFGEGSSPVGIHLIPVAAVLFFLFRGLLAGVKLHALRTRT